MEQSELTRIFKLVGKRINKLRKKKGITQSQLAETLELTEDYISHIINLIEAVLKSRKTP